MCRPTEPVATLRWPRRGSQVVRQGTANPPFTGSIPVPASRVLPPLTCADAGGGGRRLARRLTVVRILASPEPNGVLGLMPFPGVLFRRLPVGAGWADVATFGSVARGARHRGWDAARPGGRPCESSLLTCSLAWAHDPAKPDVVDLDAHGQISMVELARGVGGSPATLPASACVQLGLPPGVTIAAAAAQLLDATIDPDGPRCRPFRAASYYLRGLVRLDADLRPDASTH